MAIFGRAYPQQAAVKILRPGIPATQNLLPALADDSANDTFYASVVTPGGVALISPLFSDADTFYAPTLAPGSVELDPSLLDDSANDTFYSGSIVNATTLSPSLLDDSANDAFYQPTVSPGTVTLSPSLFSDTDTVYEPTVAPGSVGLDPSVLTDTDIFYSPNVVIAVTLAPDLFSDTDDFYQPTITGSDLLVPSLLSDTDTFYQPTVAPGAVTLSPGLFADTDIVYVCSCLPEEDFDPALFTDSDTFYSPAISGTYGLAPVLFVDADVVYAPGGSSDAILIGATFIETDVFYSPTAVFSHAVAPGLVVDADAFYRPTSYRVLLPPLFADVDNVRQPAITVGAATVRPPLFVDKDIFYTPTVAALKKTGGGGGGGGNTTGNIKYASPLVMPEAGLITTIGTTYTSSGAVNSAMAVYADKNGVPGALLGHSGNASSVTIGENDYALLTPVSVLANQKIWIAIMTDSQIGWALSSSKAGARYNSNVFTSGFSNPFGSSSTDNRQAPIFAIYLTAENATLLPDLADDSANDTFYVPTFTSQDSMSDTADYVEQDFFYQPTLGGLYEILPNGFDDTTNDAIYAPSVAVGDVAVLPSLFDADDVIYGTDIGGFGSVLPALLISDDVVYATVVTQPLNGMLPDLVDDSTNDDAIYAPAISTVAFVLPGLFDDTPEDEFIHPLTVTVGDVDGVPALYVDNDQFYLPSITAPLAVQTLIPALLSDADTVYGLFAGVDQRLSPPLFVDSDFIQVVGNPSLRHQIPVSGSDDLDAVTVLGSDDSGTVALAGNINLADTVVGTADNDVSVDGSADDEVELLGEV